MNTLVTIKGGGPAFPAEVPITNVEQVQIDDPDAAAFGEIVDQKKTILTRYPGISVRDYFAAQAIVGAALVGTLPAPAEIIANSAYELAEAMMKRRNR